MALVVGLPPRSNVDTPQYYANGPEVPTALRALQTLGDSAQTLDDEIDEQLVGIARFVNAPAGRAPLGDTAPRLTVASDLHNNVIALPALERAARGGLLLFAGDLTDRGSPVEQALVLRIARAGSELVFVSGNHDSDVLERKLARTGEIVLTRSGRLRGNGTTDGRLVQRVANVRIAGYDDPLKRLASEDYADNGATYTPAEQQRFADWLAPLLRRGRHRHGPRARARADRAAVAARRPAGGAARLRRRPHAQARRSRRSARCRCSTRARSAVAGPATWPRPAATSGWPG